MNDNWTRAENLKVVRLAHRVKEVLSADLLKPEWKRLRRQQENPDVTFGHCYAASEVMYHLYGKDNGYVPMIVKLVDGTTHWFLYHPSGAVIDVTQEQFPKPLPFHYYNGRTCGFLTKKPSKRAREIMRRMGV